MSDDKKSEPQSKVPFSYINKRVVGVRGVQDFVERVEEHSKFAESFESLSNKLSQTKRFQVTAALLYTDEDVGLARYVREHIRGIDRMSGKDIVVYIIEEPIDDNRKKEDNRVQRWLSNVSFGNEGKNSIAYNKAEAYDIAERLGILPNQLPCLVFFCGLEQPDKICVPILDNDYASLFRNVFSYVKIAFDEACGVFWYEHMYRRIRSREEVRNSWFEYLFDHLHRQIESQLVQEEMPPGAYNFYGHTVFVAGNVATEGDFVGHDKTIQGDEIAGDKIGGNKVTDDD